MAPAPERDDFSELVLHVRELSERVARLEQHAGLQPAAAPALPAIAPDFGDTAALAALFGKALLGIAAAYLLRALAESHYLPAGLGVAFGIVYAKAWMWLASRTDPSDRPTTVVRAICATAILIPLLWEALFRFRAVPDWLVAAVLVVFSSFGLAISWKKNLSAVAWVATLSGTFALFAMLIASRDLVPFTCALVALAAVVEGSACLEHWIRERWIVAAVADLSVVLMTYLVAQPSGLPEGYAPAGRAAVLAIQISLLLVYLASTTVRTLGRGFVVSAFEVAQCTAAFLVVGWGAVKVAHAHPAAVMGVGVFCALCSAGCYTVSFLFHARVNVYTFSIFGLALGLAATSLLAAGTTRIVIWSVLAVAFAASTLVWHSIAFLLCAAVVSGFGPTIAAAAVVSYLVARKSSGRAAALAICCMAAMAVAGMGATTAMLTLIALALGWVGRISRRWELTKVPYVLLAVVTVKIVIQDIPSGHMFRIVISLVLYGSALVILPRLKPRLLI